ncbi:MoaD/ThiS family protein [Hyphococcus sp. DH-69]|uniref:MoaD/ThiS family protein n=1 Tax=Hyphococcus formosus TaxID=3143534 RepID=UPI00398B51E7
MARVLFFGKLRELAGSAQREIPLGTSIKFVSDLISYFEDADNHLGAALKEQSVRVVINEEMSEKTASISDDDEIGFLPPVSGG